MRALLVAAVVAAPMVLAGPVAAEPMPTIQRAPGSALAAAPEDPGEVPK